MNRKKMKRIKLELEFIPCSEAMPEESGEYLCINHKSGYIENHSYSHEYKAFNVTDDEEDDWTSVNLWISHWAKQPDLTKANQEKPTELETCRTAYNKAMNAYIEAICLQVCKG